ncbi:shikimate 5-dehydrogenase [Pseudoxanthomonas winnipegensis]|uniref:Shikimate 5-dehydrogenase n=1 Tax=Pseudoxanthomonas winnipegensis TaxID=2480810 RepID=A0A4Q8M776_9GAMM|nr:shikimate 5-dehydrogenase [Pseudoxanthomonas winnipegensis]TAA45603.1 shikimate 5-dehydrogenase [Pseudoxanthomonas winnipegensis]
MTGRISRDTQLCMSLSGRPGNFGTRFQNYLYDALGLDYLYKAFTTTDLEGAIAGIRALGIRGCAVSMPFKEAVIPLLDGLEPSAKAIDSVNTVLNTEGVLRGYNTDYTAVATLIADSGLSPDTPVALRGSGGMAKATACALRDGGFARGWVVARNAVAGQRLARTAGWQWSEDMRGVTAGLLVNVTPIGMEGTSDAQSLAFTEAEVAAAQLVFDVVAIPVETPLIRLARALGKPVITGGEVIVLQAVEQFVLYTGVRPEPELVARAAAHALG